MKWGNREAETDIQLFFNLIMSGKCQRFGHTPQWSPENLHYILYTLRFSILPLNMVVAFRTDDMGSALDIGHL